ncbi:hypothetical protein R1sor_000558 [Riccia sorocarpa]|uniref:Cytochrome P450 n=1 Tax=Riccia sorocarpa TaxID=122646 RepID=A0ABD3GV57_9MARC
MESQRKVASYEFSTKAVRDFIIELVQRETHNRFLPLLAKVHSEGSVVDIQDLLLRFGFDNICLLGFGVDMGCLESSLPEIEFAHTFDEATRLTLKRFLWPIYVLPFLDFLARFGIGTNSKLRNMVKVVDRFAQSVIEKRRQELKLRTAHEESGELASKFSRGYSDLLSRFIQHDEETRGRNSVNAAAAMSDKYLRDIMLNFVLAGRDTSSVALTWFFWLLDQHPEVEKKMVEEVRSIRKARKASLQEHELSQKVVEGFTYEELREMHYVQAAITELMRLYPPVPADTKTAITDDYLPDGTFVQSGDRVSRILSSTRFFQAGPRICLGKEMAYTQMKYLVASILSSPYRFQLLPQPSPKFEISLTLKMKGGLMSTVRKDSCPGFDKVLRTSMRLNGEMAGPEELGLIASLKQKRAHPSWPGQETVESVTMG